MKGHQTAPIRYQNLAGQQTYRANKTPYENITAARGTSPGYRLHCASLAQGETGTWHFKGISLKTLVSTTLLCILIFAFGIKLLFPDRVMTEELDDKEPTAIIVSKPCIKQSDALHQYFDGASCFTLLMITTSNFARAPNI